MSDSETLYDWAAIREAMAGATTLKPFAGFALVGIHADGTSLYGADYGLTKRQCEEMASRLRQIAHDVEGYAKSKYVRKEVIT